MVRLFLCVVLSVHGDLESDTLLQSKATSLNPSVPSSSQGLNCADYEHTWPVPPECVPAPCVDADDGARSSQGLTCVDYGHRWPSYYCSNYDDDDFTAVDLCCHFKKRGADGHLVPYQGTVGPCDRASRSTIFISGVLRNVVEAGESHLQQYDEEYGAARWCRENTVCVGYVHAVADQQSTWMPMVVNLESRQSWSCIMSGVVEPRSGEGILAPSILHVKVKIHNGAIPTPETPCTTDGNGDHDNNDDHPTTSDSPTWNPPEETTSDSPTWTPPEEDGCEGGPICASEAECCCPASSRPGRNHGTFWRCYPDSTRPPYYETTTGPPHHEDDCSIVVTDEDGCVSVVDHGHNERCTFNMQAVPLRVVQFDTEQCCDKLTVNGVEYSGRQGPQGVTPNGPLVWYSDHSVSGSQSHSSHDTGGFKICPVGRLVETTDSPEEETTTGPPPHEEVWHVEATITKVTH